MRTTRAFIAIAGLSLSLFATAHSPLFDCFDNGDGTATCEGAFSDGATAAGVGIRVELANGRILMQGHMDDASSYTFEIPDQEYSVYFEAGDGHEIVLFGDDIY
jgi:hypothetical protein